jgi:hypothetical protein
VPRAVQKAFEANAAESLRGKGMVDALGDLTPEAQAEATRQGNEAALMDKNKVNSTLNGIRNVLNGNVLGHEGRKFGFGDALILFHKASGSSFARKLDYLGYGYARALFETGKLLTENGKYTSKGEAYNQNVFRDAIGRATAGTIGMAGAGYLMAYLGGFTPGDRHDEQPNARQFRKESGQQAGTIDIGKIVKGLTALILLKVRPSIITGLNPSQHPSRSARASMNCRITRKH